MSRRILHPRHHYNLKDNSRLSFLADQAEGIELNDDETAFTIRYSHDGAISIEGDKLSALCYTLVEHHAVRILEDEAQWFLDDTPTSAPSGVAKFQLALSSFWAR